MDIQGLKMLCYSNDSLILAENENYLERFLYKLTTISNNFNTIRWTEKIRAMVRDVMRKGMRFSYLGLQKQDWINKKKIRTQVNKVNRVANCLRNSMGNNKYMIKIYR